VFGLPLWGWKKPDVAPPPRQDGDLDAAVATMVAARMDIIRATLRARAGFLRGQAAIADSRHEQTAYTVRAEEAEFLLGIIEGGK
jgi:hypothetical protein